MIAGSNDPSSRDNPAGVKSVRDVFETALDAADQGVVSVGAIIDAYGRRAYGPLLFVLAVIMLSPVGAIPGAPLLCAVIVTLMMGQSVLRAGAPWIPGRLRRVELESARLRNGLKRVWPYIKWLDRVTRPRLTAFFRPPLVHALSLFCFAIAVSMLPLGFVPFAVAVPALALAFLGLGLMNSDGVLVLIAIAIAGGAAWLGSATIGAVG